MEKTTVAILLSLSVLLPQINGEKDRHSQEPHPDELGKGNLGHDHEPLDKELQVYNKLQGICEPNNAYVLEIEQLERVQHTLDHAEGGGEIRLKDLVEAALMLLSDQTPSDDKNEAVGHQHASLEPKVVHSLVDELFFFYALGPEERQHLRARSARLENDTLACYLRELEAMGEGFELQVRCDVFHRLTFAHKTEPRRKGGVAWLADTTHTSPLRWVIAVDGGLRYEGGSREVQCREMMRRKFNAYRELLQNSLRVMTADD